MKDWKHYLLPQEGSQRGLQKLATGSFLLIHILWGGFGSLALHTNVMGLKMDALLFFSLIILLQRRRALQTQPAQPDKVRPSGKAIFSLYAELQNHKSSLQFPFTSRR